ncbi:MAG: hypothetical protein AB7S26_32510 [Sandaracinaceae bacterium]
MGTQELLQELADVLSEERAAALRADVDRLESIQEQKRELIGRAKDQNVTDRPSFHALSEMARSNVALIRRLVSYYRALVGDEAAPSYGADGKSASGPPILARRGVL